MVSRAVPFDILDATKAGGDAGPGDVSEAAGGGGDAGPGEGSKVVGGGGGGGAWVVKRAGTAGSGDELVGAWVRYT